MIGDLLRQNVFLRRMYRTKIGRFLAHFPETIAYYSTKHHPLVPPPYRIYTGRGDYLEIGRKFFSYFKEFGSITPGSAILDVGCGIGRMAIPFTQFLSQDGVYKGFDVVPDGPNWCAKHFTPLYSNFEFKHLDVYNELYNPSGVIHLDNFKFPYNSNYFDFAFLTSVFTHMSPEFILKYLDELFRVLKIGKRALVTLSLLNDESRRLIAEGHSNMNFKMLPDSPHRAIDTKEPSHDIAVDENWFRSSASEKGFKIVMPIRYGAWAGRTKSFDYQDIVIIEKEIT